MKASNDNMLPNIISRFARNILLLHNYIKKEVSLIHLSVPTKPQIDYLDKYVTFTIIAIPTFVRYNRVQQSKIC